MLGRRWKRRVCAMKRVVFADERRKTRHCWYIESKTGK
jgi:hypothetical protein